MKNYLNDNSEETTQYLHPEVILLWAYTFFKKEEIDLDSFVMIAIECLNPGSLTPPSQELINRMSQNVQWILNNLVSNWTLISRNDNGKILFRKVSQNIQ